MKSFRPLNTTNTPHHSLADWDYSTPGPYISDKVFISPPSSLAARKDPPFEREGWAICKLAAAHNVPDGRIVSYNRLGVATFLAIHWIFRAQEPPDPNFLIHKNNYHFQFRHDRVDLYLTVGGVHTLLKTYTFSPSLSLNTWYQFRATWWQYITAGLTKLLRITLEQSIDTTWQELFCYDDSNNKWADSDINKLGFCLLHGSSALPTAIDDSELWKKAA